MPYYGFAQTSAQAFDEGQTTNDFGYLQGFSIIPIANPADGVVYAVGTNNFTINWTITDGTTTTHYWLLTSYYSLQTIVTTTNYYDLNAYY